MFLTLWLPCLAIFLFDFWRFCVGSQRFTWKNWLIEVKGHDRGQWPLCIDWSPRQDEQLVFRQPLIISYRSQNRFFDSLNHFADFRLLATLKHSMFTYFTSIQCFLWLSFDELRLDWSVHMFRTTSRRFWWMPFIRKVVKTRLLVVMVSFHIVSSTFNIVRRSKTSFKKKNALRASIDEKCTMANNRIAYIDLVVSISLFHIC